MDELGEKKGRELILKAIKDYGARVGEKTKKEVLDKGLEPAPQHFSKGEHFAVPSFEIHEKHETLKVKDEPRVGVYKCALGKVWKEYGEEKLGRLYCCVDPAKYMAYNPNYKLVHIKALPDGDDYCELTVRPTTEQERKDFSSEKKDWRLTSKISNGNKEEQTMMKVANSILESIGNMPMIKLNSVASDVEATIGAKLG